MDTEEARVAKQAGMEPISVAPEHRFDRRLSDKVLAAFTHAYAVGERRVAEQLHEILVELVGIERAEHPERRLGCPLHRADLWIAFVDARDRYRAACQARAASPDASAAALAAMKASYQRWSAA
jgi:hypothetical protein